MRMDKGLVNLCGLPMVSHIIQNMGQLFGSLVVITNNPVECEFLGVDLAPDVIPGKSSLGGLYSALYYAKTEYTAVIACDIIFANPTILLKGLRRLQSTGFDVAIPKSSQQHYEPLHSVFRVSTCKRAVLEAINQEQRRMIGWFPAVKVEEIDQVTCQRLDPSGMALFNINTPEDKQIAETYLSKQQKSSFN